MRLGRKVLTVGAAGVVLVVVGLGAWFTWAARPQETRFCTMGLAMVEIDGHEAVFQDQGGPGRDGCDFDETSRYDRTLGFDCKVRASDGEVVAEVVPNRPGGTCGLPSRDGSSPVPDPWPTR